MNYLEVCTTQDLQTELRLGDPELGLADTVSQAEDLNSEGQGLVEREDQTSEETGRYYEVVG